jgi:hypothetical protein
MSKKIDRKSNKGNKQKDESLGGAAKSLVEAVSFIVILVLLVIAAVVVSNFISSKKTPTETVVVQEAPTAKLPWDVPEYGGSVLTRYTHSGKTAIYEYDMPQGSISSVQAFYMEQLKVHEWARQPRSSQYVSEYVDSPGERTMIITLSYRSAKVHMKLQIVTVKKK